MLVCDACDKGYHTFCLQPAIDSLPTDPWKCRVSHTSFKFNLPQTLWKYAGLHMYPQQNLFFNFSIRNVFSEVSCLHGMWCQRNGAARFNSVV